MFGTFAVLREALPGYHVDYRERLSSDPAVRWTDRLVPDGTWENNLFQFFQRVVQRLSADLKIPFQLDRALYRKDDTIVHEALREAVVNALIHADYRGQGGIVIERFPDSIDLSNPGSLLVSREQLLRGSVSECRNKGLQLMFQMIGGGEKAGSGMDKIRAGWRSQHWRSPKIEETVQPDRVRLVLPMVSLIPPEVDAELRQQFGERFARLDPTAVQAVVTARVEGTVTNGRMQEITGEHPKDITGVLQGLVRDGLLEQQNQRRWASYRLVGYSLPGSPRTSGSSPQSPADSPHSGAAIPAHLQALVPLAEPARSHKRLPADEMRAVIERLCQGRWLAPCENRAKGGRGIGLRRDAPTGAGTATDLVPLSRTAFRHLAVTLSAMPPERCPPSPWNPVRHRPEHATSAAARRTTSPAQFPPPTLGPRCWPRTATRCSTTTATRWKSWASSRARWR
jgi:ATP-dependent DNA helicase RecG